MNSRDILENIEDLHDNNQRGVLIESNQAFIDKLLKGDKRCEYSVGDRVKKSIYEIGDAHQIGHEGIIIGSCYIEDLELDKREAYFIQFENDHAPSLIMKYKIELL